MRQQIVWPLLVAVVAMSLADTLSAQAPPRPTATVSGRVVDKDGQLITHERVELVYDDTVIDETASGRQGEWAFQDVRDGPYLVRTKDNCQVFATRVVVAPGQDVSGVDIVMPVGVVGVSTAAPPASAQDR